MRARLATVENRMTIDEQRVLSVEVSVLGPIHFKNQQSLFFITRRVSFEVALSGPHCQINPEFYVARRVSEGDPV